MHCKNFIIIGAAALMAASIFSNESAQAEGGVVASIKPLHSLVSAVMEGVDKPGIIVDGANSPHNFVMKPSQASSIESAKVVFWIGENLETFLAKPLETLGSNATVIALSDLSGLVRMPVREGGYFERHDHSDESDHDHEHEDDHTDESDHDHEHEDGHSHESDHEHEEDHDHDSDHEHEHEDDHAGYDSHIWLDPVNAKVIVFEIEHVLSKVYPEYADRFEENARKVAAQLDSMTEEIEKIIENVKGENFLVFHDAYQSFEQRFDVHAAGTITVNPEIAPGAERIVEIRKKIEEVGVECIFSEPQYSDKIVEVLTENNSTRSGVLDPLGANLDNGPSLYFDMMRNLATSIQECLETRS